MSKRRNSTPELPPARAARITPEDEEILLGDEREDYMGIPPLLPTPTNVYRSDAEQCQSKFSLPALFCLGGIQKLILLLLLLLVKLITPLYRVLYLC
eukprot:sb/3478967/